MSISDLARRDFAALMLSDVDAWATASTITDLAGVTSPLVGVPNEIHGNIDADLDVRVSGASATFACELSALPAGDRPRNVSDYNLRPWVITTAMTPTSPIRKYKIVEAHADEVAGSMLFHMVPYATL